MTVFESDFDELLTTIRKFSQGGVGVYLVGGAVRDALLNSPIHDLDFVLSGDVRPLARTVADKLDGVFYMLDDVRNTARVMVKDSFGQALSLDFSTFRGKDLEEDLRERDFTINAMALQISEINRLIDPLSGARDLQEKRLRSCSQTSFRDDPLRIMRAVRLSIALNLRIDPDTYHLMKEAIPWMGGISSERQRDELFKIFDGSHVVSAIRLLDLLGIIPLLLPELDRTKGVYQSAPHHYDVWEHTLALIRELERIWSALVEQYQEDLSSNLIIGYAVTRLGHFRANLMNHFQKSLNPNRSLRSLIFLASLYHDVAKPGVKLVDETGRTRFFDHPERGGDMIVDRGRVLALSQDEIQRLDLIVRQHMRIHFLVKDNHKVSKRTIYRYFRSTGEAGIDICLLSLADLLAIHGPELPFQEWQAEVEVCRILLEAYWDEHEALINPPRIINGNDLMLELNLRAGRQIGDLLEAIREEQVEGKIKTKSEALDLARRLLKSLSHVG